jgi:hypothetical protein
MATQSIEILSGSELVSALSKSDTVVKRSLFFQSASWIKLWDTQPDFAVFAVVALEGGDLLGYMPFCTRIRHGITECYSMPMGTYGSAVVFDGDAKTAGSIKKFFLDWCDKKRFARINIVEFHSRREPLFDEFTARGMMTYMLKLDSDEESLENAMSEGHRRNIRKSDKCGFDSRQLKAAEDVVVYYSLVEESARRHNAKPRYGIEFYLSLLEQLSPKYILWELVYLDDEPCVGHIYFKWGGDIHYWDGASNQTGLDKRANYFLFWKNIRQFAKEGAMFLNLGASPPEADDLVRFKKGWGAREASYLEYDKSSAIYRGMRHIEDWLR